MPKRKQQTNEEMMAQLMTFPRTGALMHAFVFEAITKYADLCIKAGAAHFESPLLSGEGWIRCANEAREAVRAHLAQS